MLFAQQTPFDPTRAPEGMQTAWAYCHVPSGSEVDMTERIEAQVERFAPGFRDRIVARHVMGPGSMELHDANYIGGDINGGVGDFRQFAARPVLSPAPVGDPGVRAVPVLVVDATGRRRARHVRVPRRADGPQARTLSDATGFGDRSVRLLPARGHGPPPAQDVADPPRRAPRQSGEPPSGELPCSSQVSRRISGLKSSLCT